MSNNNGNTTAEGKEVKNTAINGSISISTNDVSANDVSANDFEPRTMLNKVSTGAGSGVVETAIRLPFVAAQTHAVVNDCSYANAARNIYNTGGLSKFWDGKRGFAIAGTARALHRAGAYSMNDALNEKKVPTLAIAVCTTAWETAVTSASDTALTISQAQKTKEQKADPRAAMRALTDKHGAWRVVGNGAIGAFTRNYVFAAALFGPGNACPELKEKYPLTTAFASSAFAAAVSTPCETARAKSVVDPSKSFMRHMYEVGKSTPFRYATGRMGISMLTAGTSKAIYDCMSKGASRSASSSASRGVQNAASATK